MVVRAFLKALTKHTRFFSSRDCEFEVLDSHFTKSSRSIATNNHSKFCTHEALKKKASNQHRLQMGKRFFLSLALCFGCDANWTILSRHRSNDHELSDCTKA